VQFLTFVFWVCWAPKPCHRAHNVILSLFRYVLTHGDTSLRFSNFAGDRALPRKCNSSTFSARYKMRGEIKRIGGAAGRVQARVVHHPRTFPSGPISLRISLSSRIWVPNCILWAINAFSCRRDAGAPLVSPDPLGGPFWPIFDHCKTNPRGTPNMSF
jgi:hypothetical protein